MPKRIIICCDGTWNTPEQREHDKYVPTNVVKVARAVKSVAGDGTAQVVFYDQGVGTGNFLDKILGGATGSGLLRNVTDAYRFLVHNYVPGDEIFLFGFSRGAYTARSTAGLIRNCGVVKKQYAGQIPQAVQIYRSRKPEDHPNADVPKQFRRQFSYEPKIKFIGVWDTVGSLGIPVTELRLLFNRNKYSFHDVEISSIIENAYHALAVDEKRKPFKATLWDSEAMKNPNMEQEWFPGVHSNCGGGYPDSGLSDVTFMWMKGKAEACGLEFDEDYVAANVHPDVTGTLYNSYTLFYRLLGRYLRKIGLTKAGNEKVHEATLKRLQALADQYHPENLLEYLGVAPEDNNSPTAK